jgi:colanic acid/amylovoran biosynthesis glycosyltransferase
MKDLDLISGKLITTFHGSDVTSNYEDNREKYKIIFNKADLCTVNSNFLRKKVVDLDCNKNKIKRLPVGVDLNFFRPKRKKYNNKKEELIIISVARLVEYKGLEYSIKAVSEIIKKYPEKKVKYYIVGNGKEKSNLKKLINKLELNNFVTLEGGKKREEVKKYYNQSDIFILPSINYHDGREEAQGLVLQEAQAMGLPVISTNVGGIPEGVIAKKTGFIVQDKSVDQLANKIEFFIKNPDEIKKMGQAGRKYIKENFDQEKLNDSLEAIYFSLKS